MSLLPPSVGTLLNISTGGDGNTTTSLTSTAPFLPRYTAADTLAANAGHVVAELVVASFMMASSLLVILASRHPSVARNGGANINQLSRTSYVSFTYGLLLPLNIVWVGVKDGPVTDVDFCHAYGLFLTFLGVLIYWNIALQSKGKNPWMVVVANHLPFSSSRCSVRCVQVSACACPPDATTCQPIRQQIPRNNNGTNQTNEANRSEYELLFY